MCICCADGLHKGLSRRAVFGGAAMGMMASGLLGRAALAADPVKSALTPDAALKAIMDGHRQYLSGKAATGDYAAGRAGRAMGQAPTAAFLSCADSRVIPELIFNQGPGKAFVVRVAGNVENADAMASLEYGAAVLGIPLIVVLGHSACGAVDAAIKVYKDNLKLPGHLPGLMDLIVPAVAAAAETKPKDLLAAATAENVRMTVKTISTTEPVLAPMVKAGKLKVVGGVYDIGTGKIAMV